MEFPHSINGISIVVPNYNGQTLLPRILPAAFNALANTGLPYELIVVDDASTDDSIQLLQNSFPQVKLLTNQTNSGFSVTANKGFYNATYEWVLLLNSDVILEHDYFSHLLPYTNRKNVFGVMGRILGWDNDLQQDGAKYPQRQICKIKTSLNYILENPAINNEGLASVYLSGANAFIQKDVFLKLGGFNELFSPYYAEDTELSIRAWRLGYQCLYEHAAVCRHQTSSTISTSNRKKEVKIIYNRNKMFLHAIHLDDLEKTIWKMQLFVEIGLKLLVGKTVLLKSYLQFRQQKMAIQQSRAHLLNQAAGKKLYSVSEIFNKITARIGDQSIIKFKHQS